MPQNPVDFEFECEHSPILWQVHRFQTTQGVNQVYAMDLELVTSSLDARVQELLGLSCHIQLLRDGVHRSFYGILTSVQGLGVRTDRLLVAVRVEPAFALMGYGERCRIFHAKSVREICELVLKQGLTGYQRTQIWQTKDRGTKARDYCVQYQESDRDFVLRLLQEEGINYYFRHDEKLKYEQIVMFEDHDRLPLLENTDAHAIFPVATSGTGPCDLQSITQLFRQDRLALRQVQASQWHWQSGALTQAQSPPSLAQATTGIKILPGSARPVHPNQETRVQDAMQIALGERVQVQGSSQALSLRAGGMIQIEGHEQPALDGRYVITQVTHRGHCPQVLLHPTDFEDMGIEAYCYENEFLALPQTIPLRPKPTLARPKIFGPQTARVHGPKGEQIHTNELGQVMLKFHWEGPPGCAGDSPCWVRVAQSLAGSGLGAQFLPRVGMEVVVEFLEGNPDRPLVTGCVYNGKHSPPFALPEHKTQSGYVSGIDGSPGHVLRVEDQKGAEEIFLQSQGELRLEIARKGEQRYGESLCIKVGDCELTMNDKGQVEITGTSISVHGDQVKVNGQSVEVVATGKASIRGAVIELN